MSLQLVNVNITEKHIHKNIINYLKTFNYFYFHIPNELNINNNAIQNFNRKIMGVVSGVPDICVLLDDGITIWLEVKSKKGRLSASQKAFHTKMTSLKHRVYVVRDVLDVDAIFKKVKSDR